MNAPPRRLEGPGTASSDASAGAGHPRPGPRGVDRELSRWELDAGHIKVFSERWPLKYLVSNEGLCLGVDLVRASYLLLLHRGGFIFERRPVGDTVVEDLNYEIRAIVAELRREHGQVLPSPAPAR